MGIVDGLKRHAKARDDAPLTKRRTITAGISTQIIARPSFLTCRIE